MIHIKKILSKNENVDAKMIIPTDRESNHDHKICQYNSIMGFFFFTFPILDQFKLSLNYSQSNLVG